MSNIYYYYLALLFFILFLKRVYYHSKNKLPPSPLAIPIIGHYYLIKNSLYLALASLLTQYGPVLFLQFGCQSFLVVSSPSIVKECLTKHDMSFSNRPICMAGDHLTFNYALFPWAPISGHYWKALRRLTTTELFSTNSLQKSTSIREEETQTLVRLIFKASTDGTYKIDLDYLISIFVINVMMRLVTGTCYVEEEDAGTESAKNKVEKHRRIFRPSIVMNVCDYFPILKLFGYKGIEKNMISLQEEKNDFIQGRLDDTRQQIANEVNSNAFVKREKKATLFDTLFALQQLEPDFYTDDLIKSLCLIVFSAGAHPTCEILEWAMPLLLTHPNELQKLIKEIDNNVGHERLLNESDLPKLPYLHCVVSEILRLHPPLPLLGPHTSSEDCVVGGYNVPKGTTLMVNAWAMHRDHKVWEEPNMFKPERFHGLEVQREFGVGGKFVPFGMGRRGCPGEDMAIRTMVLGLGALIQCFEWNMIDENDDKKILNVSRVTMAYAKPLEAICIPKKHQFLSHL